MQQRGGRMKKKIKKKLSYADNILLLILVISITSIVSAFSFIHLLRFLTLLIPNLTQVSVGKEDTWLLFLGSLLGGSLTLLVLVITINHNEKVRNEEKSHLVMPICVISVSKQAKTSISTLKNLQFTISNVSNNLVNNLKVKEIKFTTLELDEGKIYKSFIEYQDQLNVVSNIIPPHQSITFNSNCFMLSQLEIDDLISRVDVNVTVEYTDIYSSRYYTLEYESQYRVEVKSGGFNEYYTDDNVHHFRKEFTFLNARNSHK